MTRKDYILIADTLKDNKWETIKDIVSDLCVTLKIDNPKFNKDIFINRVKGQ